MWRGAVHKQLRATGISLRTFVKQSALKPITCGRTGSLGIIASSRGMNRFSIGAEIDESRVRLSIYSLDDPGSQ